MGLMDIFKRSPKTALVVGAPNLANPEVLHKTMEAMEAIVVEKVTKRSFLDGIWRSRETIQNSQVQAAYASIFTQVSTLRVKMFQAIEEIRTFWLADAILDQITEDALAPDVTTGGILQVTSKDAKIKAEIEKLNERFNFDKMALDITPEMVAYGDYTLSTKVNPSPEAEKDAEKRADAKAKAQDNESMSEDIGDPYIGSDEYGLLELHDDLVQHQVIALTRFSKIDGYLVMDPRNGKIVRKAPADFVKFSISNRKLRIDLVQQYAESFSNGGAINAELFKKVPRFVRVGKSLLFGAMPKLRQLMLLEQLVPAAKLQKMVNGTLVGVQLPSSYEVPKAMEACRHIENMLNKKVGVDMTKGEVTIESVMNAAGKFKVVPIMGEKGQLSSMEYDNSEPDDLLGSVEDIRKTICTSVGVPYEILFVSDDGKKGDILKRYARYLRLLKNIQRSITDGIRQICIIHLSNIGMAVKDSDIEISFKNKLIEVDSLDRLEFLDASVSMISQIRDFVFDLKGEGSPAASAVDLKPFLVFMRDHFNMIGLKNLIDVEKYKPVDEIPAQQVDKPAAGTSGEQDSRAGAGSF